MTLQISLYALQCCELNFFWNLISFKRNMLLKCSWPTQREMFFWFYKIFIFWHLHILLKRTRRSEYCLHYPRILQMGLQLAWIFWSVTSAVKAVNMVEKFLFTYKLLVKLPFYCFLTAEYLNIKIFNGSRSKSHRSGGFKFG